MAPPEIAAHAADLDARFGRLDAERVIEITLDLLAAKGLAAISSFGADSAVLLRMIAEVDRDLPVLFLETGKHFPETLAYRDLLVAELGLTQVVQVTPYPHAVAGLDSNGRLFAHDPDACCALRKVGPMQRALVPYAGWFTGRKRYQAATRSELAVFEEAEGKIRINPLAGWSAADIEAYLQRHDLPRHPLVEQGYLSIGCAPCTRAVGAGADARSGRWAGFAKTECGIHLGKARSGSQGEGAGNV